VFLGFGEAKKTYKEIKTVYTRYYNPEVFVQALDGIDRKNHIIATYFMDDELPGEDFIDYFSLIQSMAIEGSTGTWEKVAEDTQDVREPKNRCALSMGIGMHRVGLDVALVLIERVEDVHPFVGAARDEVVEQGDVQVGDVVVYLALVNGRHQRI